MVVRKTLIFSGFFFYGLLLLQIIWEGSSQVELFGVPLVYPFLILLSLYMTPTFNEMMVKTYEEMKETHLNALDKRIIIPVLLTIVFMLSLTVQYVAVRMFFPDLYQLTLWNIPVHIPCEVLISVLLISYYAKVMKEFGLGR